MKNISLKIRTFLQKRTSNIIESVVSPLASVGKYCNLKHVELGDYSYVANNTKLFRTTIGKFCSIGPHVRIGLGMHPTHFVSTHPYFYSKIAQVDLERDHVLPEFQEFKKCVIGNDVWIGGYAMVLDGVSIGDGAIIGAGAVVTKNVEPYSVVVGVPARHIRYRFNQAQREQVLDLKWWDWSPKLIRERASKFLSLEQFIEDFRGNDN